MNEQKLVRNTVPRWPAGLDPFVWDYPEHAGFAWRGEMFLKWFTVMDQLATLRKAWGSGFSVPPFCPWPKLWFVWHRLRHIFSTQQNAVGVHFAQWGAQDHCAADCRAVGEPWLAHRHILFPSGLGSNLAWRSYVLSRANTSNKASWESKTAKVLWPGLRSIKGRGWKHSSFHFDLLSRLNHHSLSN